MKSLLSSSLGRQSPSFTQRMEAKKRQEGEEEARKRQHSSSPQQRMGLSSSYNGPSTLRSFLYSSSSSPAQTIAHETPALSDEDSSSMESMVVIEGFLTKQGQRFKTWKRRWCVVLADPPASRSGTPNVERRDDLYEDGERQPLGRKAKLYYAKQPQSRSSRGEVTLDHFSVLDISTGSLDEEAMALQPSDLMPTSHCFCVNTQKRVYYFCCDTTEDLVRWQRALQSLTPHNQNRSDDDAQPRQPRLEREVRHLLRDLCEVMRDHDVDGGNGNGDDDGSGHVDGADDSDPEEAQDYVAKGKEAVRDGSFSPGSQKKQKQKKKGNRKEEKRREKERKWLRVIEAEVQQAETIEDEDERWEEWVRLKQALTKGMERALLHSDQRRAELTLRAAAAKASSMMADGSTSTTSDESEGEAAKKQKNESDGAAATKERRSENGAAGRRREGTRRAGGRDEDDQDDGWNSDGFDTSREATLAREIMGQRADDSGHRDDEGLYGDDSDGGLLDDDAQQGESDDTEDEEDGLLESDKRRHAKRKRKSRRGRKKAPTRRIYSYGQEESIGFEGEPETERSFAAAGGGGGTYGTYGAQRKSGDDDGHQRDFDPTRTSSSFSFWSCFCC